MPNIFIEAIKAIARDWPLYQRARTVWDLMRGGEPAATRRLLMSQPEGLFQPFGMTAPSRYPIFFQMIRERIDDGPDRSILSFGCSTGEEVASLRVLFPQSTITGLDISKDRIAICRRNLPADQADRTFFHVAHTCASQLPASHDAVFAMSVFRHGGLGHAPQTADDYLRFDRFDREITHIAACLKPGGYLIIRNANFRFEDSTVAGGFDALLDLPMGSPVYDRHNHLIAADVREGVIFRKRQ